MKESYYQKKVKCLSDIVSTIIEKSYQDKIKLDYNFRGDGFEDYFFTLFEFKGVYNNSLRIYCFVYYDFIKNTFKIYNIPFERFMKLKSIFKNFELNYSALIKVIEFDYYRSDCKEYQIPTELLNKMIYVVTMNNC